MIKNKKLFEKLRNTLQFFFYNRRLHNLTIKLFRRGRMQIPDEHGQWEWHLTAVYVLGQANNN